MQDKAATPAEALKSARERERTSPPRRVVAERGNRSWANVNEHYSRVFSTVGDHQMTAGAELTNQFNARYLGMASPCALPSAVGGHDVPKQVR